MYRWVRERHMIGIRGRNFLEAPWAGGVVLLGCVIVAMLLANLPGTSLYYRHLLETDLSLMVHSPDGLIDWVFPRGMTVEKLINDGLMVIFFFAVGLEIKREIVCGQLSSARQAILPVLAAAGGMLAPAIIFLFFNHGTIAANGWGIPTATDIAFAIGILSMLGDRVPVSLKIFLTALAIADDLGAILVILETDSNVMPTAGTIDALGNFTASSATNSIAVPTNRKEFVLGLLPVDILSTMTVKVMTTDGLTYSDKSFTLAGLKRNHHYTMSVPCNKKTVTITVPDAIDQKYGTHTYQDNGFYTVDSQYDPEGIFNDWYFYQAEIKSDKNGDDKLKKNRIQLQVPAGFNNANNGAFVTAPIQCEGSKTVKVSFEVATNRIRNIEYRIGVTGNGPITESWLRDRNNILNGNDQKCKSGTQTHTFTVTNGQRIMIKILSTAGSYHVEFADFTYTVE